ncbi:MAG: hypothetical protein LBR19_01755, partial [Bifidobacteriaceae bacterium]|nr:hypothetical protein [Bifidobacteriaceae bacterium]
MITQKVKRRTRRSVWAAGLAVACLAALGSPALAADDPQPGALATYWDNPNATLNLRWTGVWYTRASVAFIGDLAAEEAPIAVPGDQIHRTLKVRNDGPCEADLTVAIEDPYTTDYRDTMNGQGPGDPEGAFEDMSLIYWNIEGVRNPAGGVKFSAIVAGAVASGVNQYQLATIPMAQGQTVSVQIGYEFPWEETKGKNMGFNSERLNFNILLTLRGDYCPSGPPETDSPTPSGPSSSPSADLSFTGTNALSVGVAAVIIVVLGRLLMLGAARR